MVWMYHSISEVEHDPYRVTVSPGRFGRQLRWLAKHGLRGRAMREAYTSGGRVALTFDDGYADFIEEAVPILAEFGFTATVFVLPGMLGGVNEWDPGGPVKRLMTADQIRAAAAAGMEIASHGMRHHPLPSLGDGQLVEEVAASRALLAELTGAEIDGFAYPYGAFDERCRRAVEDAGYRYACAVRGPQRPGRHAVPRRFIGETDNAFRLRCKHFLHTWRTR